MSNFKKNTQKTEDPHKGLIGHPELDAILGNSILKGQLIFIEQDSPTTLYKQLIRYSIGNSYHKDQISLIYDECPQQWNNLVPQKQSTQQQLSQEQQLQQENKIAWRYKNMENQFKITNIDNTLLRLDLSKSENIKDSQLLRSFKYTEKMKELILDINSTYQKALKNSKDSSLKKLILHELFEQYQNEEEIITFLYALKVLIRSSFMLCIITIPHMYPNKSILYPFCDFYLKISQIFGNKEFSDFQGFLIIEKVGCGGVFTQVQLEHNRWGIKATNKDFKIEMLYETAIQGDSDEDDQKLKLVCGAKPNDKQQLEF